MGLSGEPSEDLEPAAVRAALGERPFQAYPALLSTEPVAMAWARGGGPAGGVVVADYQASPRGRGGWTWHVEQGRGLGFSLVLRPDLTAEREGWLYVAASVGLGDVLADLVGAAVAFRWPDAVLAAEPSGEDRVLARLGASAHLGPQGAEWAVVTVLVEDVRPPRAGLLARLVRAVEERAEQAPRDVLADYRPRCRTLGEHVRARLVPLGPAGPQVVGEAVTVLDDGAIVLRTARSNRVAVRVPNLGLLEPAD